MTDPEYYPKTTFAVFYDSNFDTLYITFKESRNTFNRLINNKARLVLEEESEALVGLEIFGASTETDTTIAAYVSKAMSGVSTAKS